MELRHHRRAIIGVLFLVLCCNFYLQNRLGLLQFRILTGKKIDTGCAWGSTQNPIWTNNTEKENDLFWKVQACHNRIFPFRKERWVPQERPWPSSMRCGPNGTDDGIMKHVESIIASFQHVNFLGDSITRQQFYTLICTLDPALGVADLKIATPEHKDLEYVYKNNHTNSSTTLVFYHVTLNMTDKKFLAKMGPDSVDQIINLINIGMHYHNARQLRNAATSIRDIAQETKAPVFFIESTDPQWPTSDTEFVPKCGDCICETYTKERILGFGNFTGPRRYYQEYSSSRTIFTPGVFNQSYPYLFQGNLSSPCIPHCIPANWRNDITNDIMTRDMTGKKPVPVVPIWKQLVSHGHVHMRSHGDCTHKSTDALLAMNQQVLRAMKRLVDSKEKSKS